MISKFAFFSILLLATAALALPPSQLGALLSRGVNTQSQPNNHSPSIIRRTSHNRDWAGLQHQSYFDDRLIDRAAVRFEVPAIDVTSTPNSRVTFAVAIGNPTARWCNILLAGVEVNVNDGRILAHPVWATIPDDIHSFRTVDTPHYPILVGDVITLEVYTEQFARIPSDNPVSNTVAQAMVVSTRDGHGGWLNLTNFGTLRFSEFRVNYYGSNGTYTIPGRIEYFDIQRGRDLPLTFTEPVHGGTATVLFLDLAHLNV